MLLPVLLHQAAQTSVEMPRKSSLLTLIFTVMFCLLVLYIDPWLVARRTPQQHHVSSCVIVNALQHLYDYYMNQTLSKTIIIVFMCSCYLGTVTCLICMFY